MVFLGSSGKLWEAWGALGKQCGNSEKWQEALGITVVFLGITVVFLGSSEIFLGSSRKLWEARGAPVELWDSLGCSREAPGSSGIHGLHRSCSQLKPAPNLSTGTAEQMGSSSKSLDPLPATDVGPDPGQLLVLC